MYINNRVTQINNTDCEIIIEIMRLLLYYRDCETHFTKVWKLGRITCVDYGYDPINSLNGANDRLVEKWKDRSEAIREKKARVNARAL